MYTAPVVIQVCYLFFVATFRSFCVLTYLLSAKFCRTSQACPAVFNLIIFRARASRGGQDHASNVLSSHSTGGILFPCRVLFLERTNTDVLIGSDTITTY